MGAASAATAAALAPTEAPLVPIEQSFHPEALTNLCAPVTSNACALDRVLDAPATEMTTVKRDETAMLTGWAADDVTSSVPPVLLIELAGPKNYYATATPGRTNRPDVAAALKSPDVLRSGYDVLTSFHEVDPGDYALGILQVTASGRSLTCDTRRKLRIEP
jgi:hypothetical protein